MQALRGPPLPVRLLTVPVSLNFFSSLLMLFFVYYLFANLFVNSIPLSLQLMQIFEQNLIFLAENHVYQTLQ